ncbi:nucleotidyl transferase AbiEii/AbiGii toxin family protein [Ferrimicrobium sp.]|uniref:nucleotidyl transferase AbiEii/AbiGii toxin family protein n=1 Tax=Ferrimicrobium sp. TaxID=2926050 RepID=UPI00345C4326
MSKDIYFDREQVVELLNDLSRALGARNTRAEIFLVGGSAMSLCYSPRRLTRDLDAVFEPKTIVYEIASEIATPAISQGRGSTMVSRVFLIVMILRLMSSLRVNG